MRKLLQRRLLQSISTELSVFMWPLQGQESNLTGLLAMLRPTLDAQLLALLNSQGFCCHLSNLI
jgi:hypothetical protein